MQFVWCLFLVFCVGVSAVPENARYTVSTVERDRANLISLPLYLQLEILRRASVQDVQAMRAVHPVLNAAIESDLSLPYWNETLRDQLRPMCAKQRCHFMFQCSVHFLQRLSEPLEIDLDGSMTTEEMLHFDQVFAASGLTYSVVYAGQMFWNSFSALIAVHTLTLKGIRMVGLHAFVLPSILKALVLSKVEMIRLDASYIPPSLERLALQDSLFFELHHLQKLLHLRVLEITGRAEIIDLPRMAGEWPPSLRELRVPWPSHLFDPKAYVFPNTLQVLDLSHSQISTLAHLTLPDGLLHLDLSSSTVTTLDGVHLPNGLVTLNLYGTSIKSLDGLVYPATLRVLDLRKTAITSIDTAGMPELLDILLY